MFLGSIHPVCQCHLNEICDAGGIFVLPKAQYRPAFLFPEPSGLGISSNIAVDLGHPPIGAGVGRREVLGASVPETSIDADDDLRAGKYDIASSTDRRYGSMIHTVAATACKKNMSNLKFGFGVMSMRVAHPATNLWGDVIHHSCSP